MNVIKYTIILLGIGLLGLMSSCTDDEIYTGDDYALSFEMDTLRFDTVFTEVGSTTKFVKIYNNDDRIVELSGIHLANSNSKFRLNVNGETTLPIDNVTIQPNDSLYIFVEVTIDPDDPLSESPFIVEDAIVFTNADQQQIHLEAFGQNANYIPRSSALSTVSYLSCDFATQTLDDPKPYVLYGSLVIDSCTLELPAGCRLYVHGGIANNDFGLYNDGLIIIQPSGRIVSNGTTNNPVIIQTDRLEEEFQDVPSQWSGIRISSNLDNKLQNTIIKHAIVGTRVDSAAVAEFDNCTFGHIGSNAIIGIHSDIKASNCLIYDTGNHGINLVYGGEYVFDYCTVANPSSQTFALSANNFLCRDADCIDVSVYPFDGKFTNCIFSGSNSDEVWMTNATDVPEAMTYWFDHCILRVEELLDANLQPNFFESTRDVIQFETFQDPLYINADSFDYHLDTMSIAIDKGIEIPSINVDIEGTQRDNMPDIGCYEFY